MSDQLDRPQEETEEHPRGTFVLAIGFVVLIVLLWLWTYATLLVRG